MGRLKWVETPPHGWRSGPYQIELLGPRTWVLSLSPGESRVVSAVAQTPTLGEAKRVAEQWEHRALRRQMVWRRLLVIVAGGILFGLASTEPGVWTIPLVVVAAFIGLRSLASLIDVVTGGAWNRLSDSFQ